MTDLPLSSAELRAWLRLSLTPGVGNRLAQQLLQAFGLPEQVFMQSIHDVETLASQRQARALATEPEGLDALHKVTWEWLGADPAQRRVLTLGDANYPSALLNMEDPPLMLYALGPAQVWDALAYGETSIAIVGSRNPTPQGAENARQFAHAFASAGLTVVSGMALGIDSAAHEGALDGAAFAQGADGIVTPAGIATIAVVGTGLDRVYPKQNWALAQRIAQHGVLLSEYHLGTPPLAANFPKRNRLIAALSRGTLVIEAALQSGSLITARLATELGKDVFAVPGSIHSTQARGCHALIKQGAKLVESAQDVLEEFEFHTAARTPLALPTADTSPDPETHTLLQAMGFDPMGLDALQARTGLDTPHLQAQLLRLELSGRVARLPGGLFQRIART